MSFVILTRNSSRTIRDCLDGLAELSVVVGDVVVVDGGSVDGTLEIVSEYRGFFPMKVLSDEGRGLGYARDVGWRATSSPYVVMLDSDVVVNKDFVSEAVDLMERDSKLGGVAAKLKPVIKYGGWSSVFQAKNLAIHLHLDDPCYPAEAVALHTGCTMFRRSALEKVGGFDHFFRLAKEDSDISFRLRKAGYRLAFLPHVAIHLERPRFWKTNFRYGRSYVHIAVKHPEMAPLFTSKNIILTVALFIPPLQVLIYLHYLRRYLKLYDLTMVEKIVLPFIETVRQAVRTAGMFYEFLLGLVRPGEVRG